MGGGIIKLKVIRVWCRFKGPGRGDCFHFVGLPERSIPGQHDGPDDTVDEYGIPNDWCEYCWLSYKYEQLQKTIMKCEVCGKTPCLPPHGNGISLFRINPIGELGIWRCKEHLTTEQTAKINPEVKELVEILENR